MSWVFGDSFFATDPVEPKQPYRIGAFTIKYYYWPEQVALKAKSFNHAVLTQLFHACRVLV